MGWKHTKLDKKFGEEIQSFLPEKIIDFHAHLYRIRDLNLKNPDSFLSEGEKIVDYAFWKRTLEDIMGKGKLKGGLFLGYPTPEADIKTNNEFLIEETKDRELSKCLILVKPDTDREYIERIVKNPAVGGFKPYHYYSSEKPTFESSPYGFLPEWLWEIADENKLFITLHLVKNNAFSDKENIKYIREMTEKYPQAKLILAHAARGFNYENTVKGTLKLKDIDNLWFDLSAICEQEPILSLLETFGPSKLLWGSDFPVSEIHGRAVTVGNGFVWVTDSLVSFKEISPKVEPTLILIESLRALKNAAKSFGLNEKDIADMFYYNALKLMFPEKREGNITKDLYKKAKRIIPGGTQLLSKRPEMMAPNLWPAYFSRAKGSEVWDLDNKHYYDMSTNGIGTCLLGYNDKDVNNAVKRRINMGSMSTLNPPEEVDLAEMLIDIHKWAENVRFTRTGGEAVAVAVRIARATTDKSKIAICGYHGWHDWYLAANLGDSDNLRGHLLPGLKPLGVPRELRNTAFTFHYNSIEEFDNIIENHGKELAAVVMEPARYHPPEKGFLEHIRKTTKKYGIILIFDEITIGWRLFYGGAHLKFKVQPDIAVFAKALGNGYPIGAIIGTKEAMEGANKSFISSTYWTESIGPVAAIETLKKMKKVKVYEYVNKVGDKVKEFWKTNSERYNLPVIVDEKGFSCLAHFSFEGKFANELKTLYTQKMLERGFLASTAIYPTLAHTEKIIALYGEAIEEVFKEISDIIEKGIIKESLKGPVAHTGFKRLL